MNKQYNNQLKDIFKKLAFNNNYKIVGSAKSNLFFGDYDLNSVLNYRGKEYPLLLFLVSLRRYLNLLNPMITFGLLTLKLVKMKLGCL